GFDLEMDGTLIGRTTIEGTMTRAPEPPAAGESGDRPRQLPAEPPRDVKEDPAEEGGHPPVDAGPARPARPNEGDKPPSQEEPASARERDARFGSAGERTAPGE